MEVNPQYTFDKNGNAVGGDEEIHLSITEWQQKLLDEELEQTKNDPSQLLKWDDIKNHF